MPTAAKLVAALLFAVLGFVASEVALPLLKGLPVVPHTPSINAAIGLLIGWFVAGPRAGGGIADGVSNGITATFVAVMAVMAAHGTIFMWRAATRGRYRDPVDAIEGMVDFVLQAAYRLSTPEMAAVLIIGGIAIGVLLELTQSQAA